MKTTNILQIILIIGCILNIALGLNILTKKYDEADIDRAYTKGYVEYQKDTYLPKPKHKQPDVRLKEKILG